MKDRIKQFMLDKGMTQKALAAELCISEATLTGIFTGRTRPTVNIIDAFHQFFPEVNMYWLMYGEGEIYSSSASSEGSSSESENSATSSSSASPLSSADVRQTTLSGASEGAHYGDLFSATAHQTSAPHPSMQVPQQMVMPQVIEKYIDKPRRKITEIRIFFDDGTYETFTP